jgi:hypothetical protein
VGEVDQELCWFRDPWPPACIPVPFLAGARYAPVFLRTTKIEGRARDHLLTLFGFTDGLGSGNSKNATAPRALL